MKIPNKKLIAYVNEHTGLKGVKYLPQNIKKTSRPANFVKKYGGDPNSLIWLYHPQKRYVGMMVRKDLAAKPDVKKWVEGRSKKHMETGKEYVMVLF